MRTSTVKSIAALALTGAGTALVVGFQVPETPVVATTSTTTATGSTSTTASGEATTSTAGTTSATEAPATATTTGDAAATDDTSTTTVATAGAYADGTWTGAAVDEPWGTFQVQAVVSGGQLTDVVIVAAPQDHHSTRINDQAIPALTEAAIATQSADLDLISGATWTSESYIASLQAALDDAAAAAETAA